MLCSAFKFKSYLLKYNLVQDLKAKLNNSKSSAVQSNPVQQKKFYFWTKLDIKWVVALRYGFCKKSLRIDEPLNSCTLFWAYFCHRFWVGLLLHLLHPPKIDDKYAQKKVQLVRGSSFRSDFLQNPHFKTRWSVLCCLLLHQSVLKKCL